MSPTPGRPDSSYTGVLLGRHLGRYSSRVSENEVLAILAVGGTLAGVWLGYWLQQAAESRREIREACAQAIATALETAAQFELIEVVIAGGAPAPPLRPEVAREWFLALSRVGLASPKIAAAAGRLSTAIGNATAGQAASTAAERKAARVSAMGAIEAFQTDVSRELGRRWLRR